MTRLAPSVLEKAAVLAAALSIMSISAALAQEQRSSPTNREQSSGGGQNAQGGPVAHVGAGTTDGSTTGFSGPEESGEGTPGENSLPPLPSADNCASYRDTPAYQSCLWVVLREESAGPTAEDNSAATAEDTGEAADE